jgi:hypothetical protein
MKERYRVIEQVFVGLFVGLVSIASVCAQGAAAKPTVAPNPTAALVNLGRYQIVFSSHARADTFLLDTQTGKIWARTSFTFLGGRPASLGVRATFR